MARHTVPVTMGSPRFHGRDFTGFRATEAVFPPLLRLEQHQHERAILAIVLEGGFDVHFARRSSAACAGRVSCEPATERHGNSFTRPDTRVLVLEVGADKQSELRSCREVFEHAGSWPSPDVDAIARRLTRELYNHDDVAALAAEALFHQLIAVAQRARKRQRTQAHPPAWLVAARDYLQSNFLERIELCAVAAAAGVSAMTLAREYHRFYGESPGATVRALRIRWAAEQVARTSEPLARIAHRAGFSDQSHFTRVFRRELGETPARFRKQH